MYGASEDKLKRLREKWSKLLKGIKSDETANMTAIVLENQEQEMRTVLRESTTSGYGFTPGVSGGDIDKFPKLMIPMVRRIMPQLIANEIFGVQAMEGPVGMAFTLRWVYGSTVTWTDPVTGRVYTTTASDQAYIPGTTAMNPVYSGDYNNATYESAADDATANTGGFGLRNDRGEIVSDLSYTGATQGTPTAAIGATASPYSEGSLKIINRLIEARTRKLKANWSQEAVDDIKKVHSLNLEQEIVDFLSYQIQAEIDRELILAAYNLGTTNGLFTWDIASTDGRWQEEKYKTLYHAIVKALNYIGHTTRRGRANWMVVSFEVASILSAIKAFDFGAQQPTEGFEPYEGGEGVVFLGTLEQGKVKVYLDLYWEAPANNVDKEIGYILMGYKGKKSFDSGILFCPYIPVMMMKTISPHDFHPLLSLGSRYAIVTQLLDTEKYYAVVSVRNSSL